MTASRPEGAKGNDPILVQRVYDVISDWNLNARPLTHVDLAGRIATLCAEYAREQVEDCDNCKWLTLKKGELESQLQMLRGENERLREVMRETVKEVGYLGLHVGGDGPCVACDAAQHLRAALAPRRG